MYLSYQMSWKSSNGLNIFAKTISVIYREQKELLSNLWSSKIQVTPQIMGINVLSFFSAKFEENQPTVTICQAYTHIPYKYLNYVMKTLSKRVLGIRISADLMVLGLIQEDHLNN